MGSGIGDGCKNCVIDIKNAVFAVSVTYLRFWGVKSDCASAFFGVSLPEFPFGIPVHFEMNSEIDHP